MLSLAQQLILGVLLVGGIAAGIWWVMYLVGIGKGDLFNRIALVDLLVL